MGICQCYQQTSNELMDYHKTFNFKVNSEIDGIQFTFTNLPLNQLQGDCLIFYAYHASELSRTQALNRISRRSRRKILEYLTLAEDQLLKYGTRHALVPLAVGSINFKYLLLVQIQPWDGRERNRLESKIYNLTVSYLQVFKLRKIQNFTIVEFDQFSGIHYSIGFEPITKAIKKYASDIQKVSILSNNIEQIKSIGSLDRNTVILGQLSQNFNVNQLKNLSKKEKRSTEKKKSKISEMLF